MQQAISISHRARRRAPLLGVLLLAACSSVPDEPAAAVTVECNLPTHPDTTAVHVVLEPEAREQGGRLFVRVDSLRSSDGPRFDGDSGMLVQALVARGPGYGCATVSRVGAEVWAPGAALRRSWVHVKSNYPVRVTLEDVAGTQLMHRLAFPGQAVTPLEWSGR